MQALTALAEPLSDAGSRAGDSASTGADVTPNQSSRSVEFATSSGKAIPCCEPFVDRIEIAVTEKMSTRQRMGLGEWNGRK